MVVTLAVAALLALVLVRMAARVVSRVGGRARWLAVPVWAATLALGFAWAAWRADARLADALPAALEGQDLVLVGSVAQMPQIDSDGLRFGFDVESATARDGGPAATGPATLPQRALPE